MIGVVIVSHGRLGEALVEAVEFILGQRLEKTKGVSVFIGQEPDKLKQDLRQAVEEVESGQGTIILVDMFGGSPSDMSLSFLKPGQVEVITGVNLPMLLHIINARHKNPPLAALAKEAEKRAVDAIALAGKWLNP